MEPEVQAEIDSLKYQILEISNSLNDLNNALSEVSGEIAELNQSIISLNNSVADNQSALETAQLSIGSTQEAVTAIGQSLELMNGSFQELIEGNTNEINSIVEELGDLEQGVRRVALLLSNSIHVPVDNILKFAEKDVVDDDLRTLVNDKSNEKIKEFE